MISNIVCVFLGLAYVQALAKTDGQHTQLARCPPKQRNEEGKCASMCGRPSEGPPSISVSATRNCPPGKMCCPTACGGTKCRKPITNTGCPGGERPVNCFVDPCRFATCPRFPKATKRIEKWFDTMGTAYEAGDVNHSAAPDHPCHILGSDYCGGCFCRFYVDKREVTKSCKRKS